MWGYKKMKAKYLVASILGIVILSLAVYSTLHSVNEIIITTVDEPITSGDSGVSQSIGVVLEITNERSGEVIHRMVKDDDLVLRSMAGLIHYIFKGSDIQQSQGYMVTTGASFNFDIDSTADYIRPNIAKIHIGTGSTAPVVANYKLVTKVYDDDIEAIGYTVAGLQMNVTFVTTFAIDATHAIREAGLAGYRTDGGDSDFMLFRDVFGVINVVSGDILTVKYIIMFN